MQKTRWAIGAAKKKRTSSREATTQRRTEHTALRLLTVVFPFRRCVRFVKFPAQTRKGRKGMRRQT